MGNTGSNNINGALVMGKELLTANRIFYRILPDV